MYKKNEMRWMKHYDFILLDLFCMVVAFFAGCFLRNGSFKPAVGQYRNLLIVFVLIDIVAIFFDETYSDVLKRGFLKEFRVSLTHAFYVSLLAALYMTLAKVAGQTSRIMFGLILIIYACMTYVCRCILKRHIRHRAKASLHSGKTSLMVLVENDLIEDVLRDVSNKNYEDYFIAGLCVLDKDRKGEEVNGFSVKANRNDVLDYICREWVDEVLLIAKHTAPYKDLSTGISEMGITQHIKLSVVEELPGNENIVEHIGPYVCLTSAVKTATNRQVFIKSIVDFLGGLIGCVFTVILMIVFFPIVKIKSPGPLIYASERIGKNGKRFKFYKFRSMVMNADEQKKDLMSQNRVEDGMMFKIDHDPRIIPGYGEFIRRTSLDEFPQFFNVLKGDMSLVGTRPPTPDEWEKYKLHHRIRLAAKPGMTGMWQTSGRSNITDFEEVVKLDSYYIHNWSLGLDFKLIWKTIVQVVKRDGSM